MTDRTAGLDHGLTDYGDRDFSSYLRRSFAQSMGYSRDMLAKPVIGIAYTGSDFNNCHRHFPELLAAVKRGVLAAGALPLEFPTISLGEVFLTPTSLKYRNLMAMDTEEMIRAQPMDAVVLMGGCDKTVPAQLMGAVSADRPAVMLVAGPMMTGRHRGERLGACTDCRRFWARYRAGDIDADEISAVEGQLAVTAGTCAVMGTASTMACLIEALGMCLPGTAAIPAVHADRLRAAEASGVAAVKLIGSKLTPSRLINEKSVANALRVLLALGGSTNAVIHLTAIAGRAGVKVSLDRLNALSDATPVLVNLKPVGNGYMEDFCAAGGMGALLRELKPLLHLDCLTVTGETLGERLEHDVGLCRSHDHRAVRQAAGRRGRLGCAVRQSGAEGRHPQTLGGRRQTCSSTKAARWCFRRSAIWRRGSTIRRSRSSRRIFWCCRMPDRTRPACMPEAGYLPIPKKLAQRGVKDMIRISDARMSGTAFGTIVLHVTPDAASGGPLGLVRNGDRIRLSVKNRRIELLVDEAELKKRAAAAPAQTEIPERGYGKLFAEQILGADEGCDFKFLMPK